MIYFIVLAFFVGLAISYPHIVKIISIDSAARIGLDKFSTNKTGKLLAQVEANKIKSPLSQKDCALWQVEVYIRVQGRHPHESVIYANSSNAPFMVTAEAEKIQVRPQGSQLTLQPNQSWQGGWFGNPFSKERLDPKIEEIVKNMGAKITEVNENLGVLINEYIVQAGDQVFIDGLVTSENGQKVIGADGANPIIISDGDEDQFLRSLYGKIAYNVFAAELLSVVLGIYYLYPKR